MCGHGAVRHTIPQRSLCPQPPTERAGLCHSREAGNSKVVLLAQRSRCLNRDKLTSSRGESTRAQSKLGCLFMFALKVTSDATRQRRYTPLMMSHFLDNPAHQAEPIKIKTRFRGGFLISKVRQTVLNRGQQPTCSKVAKRFLSTNKPSRGPHLLAVCLFQAVAAGNSCSRVPGFQVRHYVCAVSHEGRRSVDPCGWGRDDQNKQFCGIMYFGALVVAVSQ